ncbi:MAG: hypothetical protein ACRDZQ_04505 [Acidimicrobiales bacterium]
MATRPMVHLTTVAGIFHGRVVAARLGSDGILTELRGDVGGTYPLGGQVDVFVDPDQADDARQILLADQADAALAEGRQPGPGPVRPRPARPRRPWLHLAWLLIGVLVALYLLAMLG